MMNIDIWSFLLLFGFCQGCFLSVMLMVGKRGSVISNVLIGVIIAILSINLFSYLTISTSFYKTFPHFLHVFQPLLFLIGPLYYFYMSFSLGIKKVFGWKDSLHVLPLIGAIIFQLPFWFYTAAEKIRVGDYITQSEYVAIPVEFFVYFTLLNIQAFLYVFLAYKMLKQNTSKLSSKAPQNEFTKLKWLRTFTIVFVSYWAIATVGLILLYAFEAFSEEIDYIVFLSQSFIIHVVGYVVVKYPGIISGVEWKEARIRNRYESSVLKDEEAISLLDQLEQFMKAHKPYTNAELKIAELAQLTNIPSHHISQILNQYKELNFSDWLNAYRVHEVIEMHTQSKLLNYTLLAIAFEAGFSSKTSFNRAFKKKTGMTPSQYFKNQTAG